MNSIILKIAARYLLPLLLLFSIFVLLRGHYLPGGGFVGGLVASIAILLHAFSEGFQKVKKQMRFHPGFLMPFGLSISLISGIIPMFYGDAFMTGLWYPDKVAVIGSLGSSLFFDIGVFIVVIGATLTIIMTIAEST
jgi:multicomponent Na+:H+ antiporter subunit B